MHKVVLILIQSKFWFVTLYSVLHVNIDRFSLICDRSCKCCIFVSFCNMSHDIKTIIHCSCDNLFLPMFVLEVHFGGTKIALQSSLTYTSGREQIDTQTWNI